MADMRSSARRSAGRGTAVESDTVVDSNAASPPTSSVQRPELPPDQRCEHAHTPPRAQKSRQNGTLWTLRLKERFICLTLRAHCMRTPGARERRRELTQPRLLLIDDEPALAEFLARRGARVRVRARRSPPTTRNSATQFLADRPDMVALDLGMPGMDGVELLRFLADAGLSLAGADRQRVRPPRARIRLPARRGARPDHGRAGRKAGPPRGARSRAQPAQGDARCHEPQRPRTIARRASSRRSRSSGCRWSTSPRSRCATAA